MAMLEFEGTLLALDRTWWTFINEWLPASGYQVRTTFIFERYPAVDIAGGQLKHILKTLIGIRATLCIPIEKASATGAQVVDYHNFRQEKNLRMGFPAVILQLRLELNRYSPAKSLVQDQ
jgi:hypothetical protein